jgi:DNA-binding NarL/FixJ family response regulator
VGGDGPGLVEPGELGAVAESARARALLEELGVQAEGRPPGANEVLTARQVDVLRLVPQGLGDRDIAENLMLSEHTVHRHVANIYVRLGCSSRAAAVAEASSLGLL